MEGLSRSAASWRLENSGGKDLGLIGLKALETVFPRCKAVSKDSNVIPCLTSPVSEYLVTSKSLTQSRVLCICT